MSPQVPNPPSELIPENDSTKSLQSPQLIRRNLRKKIWTSTSRVLSTMSFTQHWELGMSKMSKIWSLLSRNYSESEVKDCYNNKEILSVFFFSSLSIALVAVLSLVHHMAICLSFFFCKTQNKCNFLIVYFRGT